MVRTGTERAILRAETVGRRTGRSTGRGRDRCRRAGPDPGQPQAGRGRRATCTTRCRCTVFSPEDLGRRQGGPGGAPAIPRRDPGRARPEGGAGGRRDRARSCASGRPCCGSGRTRRRRGRPRPSTSGTRRLDAAGTALVDGPRAPGRATSAPLVGAHYAGWPAQRDRRSTSTTERSLGRATCSRRWPSAAADDLRGACHTVGPHRDDLELVDRRAVPARTHASQGEQRCLALALRLAAHQLATERLGRRRCCCSTTSSPSSTRPAAGPWWPSCPPGQALLTTAAARAARGRGGQVYAGVADGLVRGRRAGAGEPTGRVRRRTPSPVRSTARSTRCPGGSACRIRGAGRAVRRAGTEIVGPAMAGHVRPLRLDGAASWSWRVDHPAWATQVRMARGRSWLDRVVGETGAAIRAPRGPWSQR